MGIVCACSERLQDPTGGEYEGKLVSSVSTNNNSPVQNLDPKWFNEYEKTYFKDKIAVTN